MLALWGGRAAIMDLPAEAHASYQVRLLPARHFPSSPAPGVAACTHLAWHLQCSSRVLRNKAPALVKAECSPGELPKHIHLLTIQTDSAQQQQHGDD